MTQAGTPEASERARGPLRIVQTCTPASVGGLERVVQGLADQLAEPGAVSSREGTAAVVPLRFVPFDAEHGEPSGET